MLTRSKPMSRGSKPAKLRRSVAIKRRNGPRAKERYARNFGAEADLVRGMRCVCNDGLLDELRRAGDLSTELEARWCSGAIEPAHVTSRGAGGARFDIIPLCSAHHREQHDRGIETFAAAHGLDLRAEADRVALLHEAPLGIRGLAQRLAGSKCKACNGHGWTSAGGCADCGGGPSVDRLGSGRDASVEPLTDYEREALLGWVRRMDAEVAEARTQRDSASFARGWIVAVLEEVLGVHNRHAEALVDAAGWREVCEAAGWPPDDDDDFAGWPS